MKVSHTLSVIALLAAAGCGGATHTAGVPSASRGGHPATNGVYSASRVSALHAAAQCIRSHGVPTYQDPVLTANGQVFTDARSIQDLQRAGNGPTSSTVDAIRQACGTLFTQAGFQPDDEAPAPPPLVQAGVRAARCLRANGLPNYRDPTSSTPFTPGHGFGISSDELPNNGAQGKGDPAFQRAIHACSAEVSAEIRASTLGSLSHG